MERARQASRPAREPAEPTLAGLARDLVALEFLRLRAVVDRRLTWLALGALALLGVAVVIVVASARLVLGLSAAVSDALGAAPWAGDLIVGTALPSLGLAALVLAHRRRAARRMARADRLLARQERAGGARRPPHAGDGGAPRDDEASCEDSASRKDAASREGAAAGRAA